MIDFVEAMEITYARKTKGGDLVLSFNVILFYIRVSVVNTCYFSQIQSLSKKSTFVLGTPSRTS